MPDGYDALTEKEKETLRLMVRGHDAKSMARELSLSVHTINDRLRTARRKLGVTSSREAARLVFKKEGGTPARAPDRHDGAAIDGNRLGHRDYLLIGAAIMSLLLGTILIATQASAPTIQIASDPAAEAPPDQAAQSVPQAELEDSEKFARLWLGLVDGEDFDLNSRTVISDDPNLEGWNRLVERRQKFGRATDREAQRIDIIEQSGQDRWVIYFRTDFERFRGAYERVTLAYDDSTFTAKDYEIE